jgi:hypothetical protein
MIVLLCLFVSLCSESEKNIDLWIDATYKEDAEFGNGAKTVLVEVVANDKSVTFTIHSDKTTLGDALSEHNLIDGEKGPYGLYVKKVNGIVADYDKNKAYWRFNKNGEGMMTGVDMTEFKNGEHYELIYTK